MVKTVAPRKFARDRVLDAAQQLFTEHGVSGTTLQMIADRLGVNKSAVYYQFPSKDDIVVAVFRPVFEDIARVVNIAEAITSPQVQREATISGIIELAVRHRRTTALLHTDPAVVVVVEAIGEFRDASRRLQQILAGPQPEPATLIAIAMLVPGILGAAADPAVADIANDALHRMLLDCSRRLGIALNTVKRYDRAARPEQIARPPRYRECLVDPYRDHLRTRRQAEPGVSVVQLLAEIRDQGYTGSQNLLYRYLNQNRHLDDHPQLSPRRAAMLLLTRPANLTDRQTERLAQLVAAAS